MVLVVQWEQEGSSVVLLLSTCSLVCLEGVAASKVSPHEVAKALPVCVFASHKDPHHHSRYLNQVIHDQIVHEAEGSQVDFDQEVNDGQSPP